MLQIRLRYTNRFAMKTICCFLLAALPCLPQNSGPHHGGDPMEQAASGFHLRSIGPAVASGRVISFAVDPKNHAHYFVGVASGGVWKTTNDGITWTPVFDHEGSYSIGTVALDPHNANIVWVGTGEADSQRSVNWGDGVYRSDDGGTTWHNLGLKDSQHIGRIAIDPRDSNVVYVAAQGPLWGPGGDRGLYKTTDGGKTWKKILNISENTGVTDVAIDPSHPDTLLAAAYERRRRYFTLIDGGPESALYKSDDAGATWRRVENGLPHVDLGRIGLAYSTAEPHLVYMRLEAADNQSGIYRSLDDGASWERRASFEGTPMYYGQIIPDPKDADRIYIGDTLMRISEDGGRTIRILGDRSKHVDSHTVWIDPSNTGHILVGCDGGVYESYDRGHLWDFKANLPTLQFYDVAVDYAKPFYNVYGGTQDNASLGGPSRTMSANGIANSDWFVTTGGDGFVSRADPQDPDTVYAESQEGGLVRYDRRTGTRIDIRPEAGEGAPPLRWNWDSPLIISPHLHTRLYFGSNRLWRSDDRGDSWRPVSPDLTRGLDRNALPVMGIIWGPDAVAKNHSTAFYGNITTISESPKREGLIYVGTDDGLIQVTEDGGKTWRKAPVPGVPENAYIMRMLASQNDENRVYAAIENHQNNDFKPYLFKSTDRGHTWKSIAGNLPDNAPIASIAEDQVNPDLLFVGDEYGLYFTVDGGGAWTRLHSGLPTIQVRDLAIQRRENDLVLATFGRGFYVLDDYTPLRTLNPKMLKDPAVLFPVRTALEYVETSYIGGRGKASQGEDYYTAENPPYGALITYYLRDALRTKAQQRQEAERAAEHSGKSFKYPPLSELTAEAQEPAPALTLIVTDASGRVVRRLSAPGAHGIHRVAWDLRTFSPTVPQTAGPARGGPFQEEGFRRAPMGHFVAPGKYTVVLSKFENGKTETLGAPQTIEVTALGTGPSTDFLTKVDRLQSAVAGALEEANAAKQRLGVIRTALQDSAASQRLHDELDALDQRVDNALRQLRGDPELRKLQENEPPSISQRVNGIAYGTLNLLQPPTRTMQDDYDIASSEFGALYPKLRALILVDLPKYEKELDAAHVPLTPGRFPEWRQQ
jgi:photosystem II stability/assembly factor-like uncharacterized protein